MSEYLNTQELHQLTGYAQERAAISMAQVPLDPFQAGRQQNHRFACARPALAGRQANAGAHRDEHRRHSLGGNMPKPTKYPRLKTMVRRGRSGQVWVYYAYDMRPEGKQ